jgi:DNA-binding transcriptional ArsR family regulator
MRDVQVIDTPAAAAAALDPVRSQLLAELAEPASAAALAQRLGMPRQKLNYHLRALEAHGLVEVAEKRKWGGLIERRLVATATSYMVSPAAMGTVGADPERAADRFSASYLIALAARIVREVSSLMKKSEEGNKRLATLAIDTEISFRSPAERAAFTQELSASITQLAAKYHDPQSAEARAHRLVLVAHPLPQTNFAKTQEPS